MDELCKIEAHDAEVLCLEYSSPVSVGKVGSPLRQRRYAKLNSFSILGEKLNLEHDRIGSRGLVNLQRCKSTVVFASLRHGDLERLRVPKVVCCM